MVFEAKLEVLDTVFKLIVKWQNKLIKEEGSEEISRDGETAKHSTAGLQTSRYICKSKFFP